MIIFQYFSIIFSLNMLEFFTLLYSVSRAQALARTQKTQLNVCSFPGERVYPKFLPVLKDNLFLTAI